jgi:hypothetical protein
MHSAFPSEVRLQPASLTQRLTRFLASAGLTITAAVALSVPSARADDTSALLSILERKGILTKSEVESVRAELAKEKAKEKAEVARIAAESAKSESGDSLSDRLKLSPAVSELKLYGDLRFRYQYDSRDGQLDPFPVGVHQDGDEEDRSPSGSQQSRWRFRLRVGAEFKLGEDWFGGVELSTAQASDSGNQTFENGFDDYDIFISKAYLGWNPSDALTITAGKIPNPFYTTELVWDADITPTGLAEVIRFHELFGGEGEDLGLDKDGKAIVAKKSESPWELSLVAGQFIFDDNNENNFDNDSADDAYLFQTQLVGSYKFSKNVKATFAPGWLVYNAASVSGVQNAQPFNDSPTVSGATRNINLLLAPGDITFKLLDHKVKFLWDFAYNIEGRKRYEDVYDLVTFNNDAGQSSDDDVVDPDDFSSNHKFIDDIAFLAGFQIGENKKAGDWSLLAYYRQAGVSSIDPNLNDSDFAGSRLNTRGFKTSLAYNFTDFAVGALTYQYAWNLRDDLVGGQATGGAAIADTNNISIFQVDFTLKF